MNPFDFIRVLIDTLLLRYCTYIKPYAETIIIYMHNNALLVPYSTILVVDCHYYKLLLTGYYML